MDPRITPAMQRYIDQQIVAAVAAALAEHEANRATGSGTNNNLNPPHAPRPCSYKDFLNCKPTNFNGTEGVVGLQRWFEKMESVFRISDCSENCKVKFATCTLLDSALTWWNSKVVALSPDVAYELSWDDLKRLMEEKYCPRGEIQKLQEEFWNLRVKDNDVEAYSNRFVELAMLCPDFVTPEYRKIERYIWGLAAPIQGMVTTSRMTDIQQCIQLAIDLSAQQARELAETATISNKRKWDGDNYNDYRNKQGNRLNDGQMYLAGNPGNPNYKGAQPLCNDCNRHHSGDCPPICGQCNKRGHVAKFCRVRRICYNCGETGHIQRRCPRQKDTGQTQRQDLMMANEEDMPEPGIGM